MTMIDMLYFFYNILIVYFSIPKTVLVYRTPISVTNFSVMIHQMVHQSSDG
jgi:hypothetical protein